MKRSFDYSIEHWRDMWVGYYKGLGWSGGPHFFCFPDKVVLFTPITMPGVHSPSWNGTRFGLEMVIDCDSEDPNSGPGLKIKLNAAEIFAALYGRLGLNPNDIKMHYEDKRTTHACPGNKLKKADFLRLVYECMGEAGDHTADNPELPVVPKEKLGTVSVPADDHLNLREQSSASSPIVATLMQGANLVVLSEAMNGQTKWLQVNVPSVGSQGWVSAKFVTIL